MEIDLHSLLIPFLSLWVVDFALLFKLVLLSEKEREPVSELLIGQRVSHLLLDKSAHRKKIQSWGDQTDLTSARQSVDSHTDTKSTFLKPHLSVKANELITEELIWRPDHDKRLDVFFFVIERRVRFYRPLMIALRMRASILIGFLDSLSILNFVVDQSVPQAVTEQERLKLDQYCLNGICRCPTLINLLLVRIKDV